MANHLSLEKKKQVFHLLCEGNGIRSIERVVKCSTVTIMSLQKRLFGVVNHINSLYFKDLDIEEIEADEIRTFVNNTTNLRWIYIALDRKSRMVLHFHVGKRDTNDARKFLIGLSEKLNSMSKVSTDCLRSYAKAIADHPTNADTMTQTQYIYLLRSKQVGRDSSAQHMTNRIESHNGNVRQHVSRLIRRTRCFSKKDSGLKEHLTLFFFYYNFIKKHKTLKATPSMIAGLVDKPMSLEHLIEYDAIYTGQSIKKEIKKSPPDAIIESAIGNKTIMEYEDQIAKLEISNRKLEEKIKNDIHVNKGQFGVMTASSMGRLGGLKGGIARAEKLSPERRREIAQKAAEARWGKKTVSAL